MGCQASGLGDRGDREAFTETRNTRGRAVLGRKAELNFGCVASEVVTNT